MALNLFLVLAPLGALGLTALALLLPAALNWPRMGGILALGGFALTLVLLVPAWQAAPQTIGLLRLDRYALVVTALVTASALMVCALGQDYFRRRSMADRCEIWLLLAVAALGGGVLAGAEHLAALFLGVELLGLPLAALVAHPCGRLHLEAGIKYLILSGSASALLLFGMALVYAQDGTLTFSQLRLEGLAWIGLLLMLAGLAFKLAWVPFHLWIADVYQGAPAPLAAFLASGAKAAAMAAVLRLLLESGAYRLPSLPLLLLLVACLSILIGNWLALLQTRLKRLLAYSAIAHFGYLLIVPAAAIRLGSGLAAEAVLFYLVAYTLAALLAFGLVTVLSPADPEADELTAWHGLFFRRPLAAVLLTLALLTLALLSLAGLPLTVGFVGKFYLFAAAVGAGLWLPALVLLAGSGLGMFYYLRVIRDLGRPVREESLFSLPGLSLAALLLLAALLVGMGLHPQGLILLLTAPDLPASS